MARVTAADVRVVRKTKLLDATLTVLIDAANVIVSSINAKCSKSFDETRLTQIELYLAAHYTTADDPVISEETFVDATNKVVVPANASTGIDSSRFGQMANSLSEGCLKQFDKDHRAGDSQGSLASIDFLV